MAGNSGGPWGVAVATRTVVATVNARPVAAVAAADDVRKTARSPRSTS